MAKRKARTRLYTRSGRYYADFRDYRDVGGAQEALKPPGTNRATDDRATAEALVTRRLAELQELRKDRARVGEPTRGVQLADLARRHLELKAESGTATDRWLMTVEQHLTRACEFFGARARLDRIAPNDVHRWIAALRRMPSKKGGTLSDSAVRHHLNSLSNLYQRAQELDHLPDGYNPVARIARKPVWQPREAEWLEVHEAAHLLETARTLPRRPNRCPFLYELLATFLLTGGRKAEVTGLTVDDISFDRQTVTFRPNEHRDRLKNRGSKRVVPLWPQLAEILRPYVTPLDRTPREGLLFATRNRAGQLVPVTNYDTALDQVAVRAGWKAGEIRSHGLRHTWAAARLQTLDRGQPVSKWTVQGEGGWSNADMLDDIYGHLGTVRHRADVLEYRIEQHRASIEKRFGPGLATQLTD